MSISGVGGSIASAMQSASMQRHQKPDASAVAADVFALLDSEGKGYVESSDLAKALESTGSSASAESLFGAMDTDSDGKVTEQELSSLLQKVADQFEDSFGAARVGQAMGNRPPPPPPPPGGGGDEDDGLTVDELGAMAEDAEASGSAQAADLASLVESFDEADTNGDGKVSFQEAMAFRESSQQQAGNDGAAQQARPDDGGREAHMLARVLEMLQQYAGNEGGTTSASSTLSVSA